MFEDRVSQARNSISRFCSQNTSVDELLLLTVQRAWKRHRAVFAVFADSCSCNNNPKGDNFDQSVDELEFENRQSPRKFW